jgi:hypothetical protein
VPNPLRRMKPVCPACKMSARIFRGRCSYCGAETYVPLAYFRWIWLLVIVVLIVIGTITYSHDHPGTWLLSLIFLSIPLRIVWSVLIPPWLELGRPKSGIPFLFWYVTCVTLAFLYWQAWGWLSIVLRASRGDFADLMGFFSMPLCWVNSRFFIAPDRSFSEVCGILAGNSFFYALLVFLLYRGVHARLHANRVTRMSLTPDSSEDEPE